MLRLLLLDIDGTLRPGPCSAVPKENVAAVRALQKSGVRVAVATGRGRAGLGKDLLNGLRPDFWVCAAGALVMDAGDRVLAANRFTSEEMYALVDFFENYEYPLRFTFTAASYAYIDYRWFSEWEQKRSLHNHVQDGEDQDYHLNEMPCGAFGVLPPEAAAAFGQTYPHLNLRFVYSGPGMCDILRPGVSKASGLAKLAEALGLPLSACAAMGDGDNDAEMLAAAGLGVAMDNGTAAAKAAADRVGPDAMPHGVADVCRALWPAAFAP